MESLVTKGVAHGIDGAVDVAQPVAQMPEGGGNAFWAEGGNKHHDVIWRPC